MASRTQPKVSRAAAEAAMERIASRRAQCAEWGDASLEALSDEPLEVAAYVLAHQQVPFDVMAADVLDALLLVVYARREVPALPRTLDGLEHRLLLAGRECNLTLKVLAEPLGLRSRQAVEHRLLRYASVAAGGAPNEREQRARLRRQHAERRWAARCGAELTAAAARVLARRADVVDDDLYEELGTLRTVVREVPGAQAARYAARVASLALACGQVLAAARGVRLPEGMAADLEALAGLTASYGRAVRKAVAVRAPGS